MTNSGHNSQRRQPKSLPLALALFAFLPAVAAQTPSSAGTPAPDLAARIEALNAAVEHAQVRIDESQRQIEELRQQLTTLQTQLADTQHTPAPDPPQDANSATDQSLQQIREHQAIQDAQIATHDQSKVETESKYPLKLTGLVLLNGFVNTRAVDLPATPTSALPGSGNSGLSVRQTIFGFDARGPQLWGAASSADLRVDFAGTPDSSSSTSTFSYSYATANTLLRLRTAHARLDWTDTQAYFALDRPIISPDSPASLTAVAEPALAWSGNLWMWNPQAGLTQSIPAGASTLRLDAALVDVADSPLTPASGQTTSAESSRWPGLEARIALLGSSSREDASHFGIGGYFAPHLSPFGRRYDAWAATLDTHLRLAAGLSLTASAYRGLALGGLGAGTYKDIVFRPSPGGTGYYSRPLDNVGGWLQLQEKFSERLQLNAAFGTDQAFARELSRYALPTNSYLQNLARNTTWTANAIYSPSAYLLFSLEYRRLQTAYALGETSSSNIFGAAAGYRF